MISLHTGKLGVGKSYWATREVWKYVLQGKDCYVNWKIDFSKYYAKRRRSLWFRFANPYFKLGRVFYWQTLKDLTEIWNGEVFMDEAHMSVDARDFTRLDKGFKTKLTQSRKYGLNLHFITQHSQQIDVVVRRLSNEQVVHTKFWKLFMWKRYDGEAIEILANPSMPKPKSITSGFYWFRKGIAESYDTFALFEPFEKYKVDPMWDVNKVLEKKKTAKASEVMSHDLAASKQPAKKSWLSFKFLKKKGGDKFESNSNEPKTMDKQSTRGQRTEIPRDQFRRIDGVRSRPQTVESR